VGLPFAGDATSQLGWRRATAEPTGGKQKLFGMSKGNMYLRRMLIDGARAVLLRVKYDMGGFGQWVHRLAQRARRNKVVVAIAK
jgi:transposase